MCGRYFIDDDETISEMRRIFRDIDAKYKTDSIHASDTVAAAYPQSQLQRPKSGEIFPTDIVPILLSDKGSVHPVLMSWGFPKWKGSGVLINARSETASEKPMFASSLLQRRCIVPTNGFFEWNQRAAGPGKQKYLLRKEDEHMLYLAGLYSSFIKPDGAPYEAFVILTVAANPSVSTLHDRMPLIVERPDCTEWLADSKFANSLLHVPCESIMSLSPVS